MRNLLTLLAISCLCLQSPLQAQDTLKLLFLGDNGNHRPVERFHQLAPVLEAEGIALQYTDQVEKLTLETLNQFDGLIVYANIDTITKEQADALLAYVESGKAFVPLHCATYCFRNDDRIVALMGGQFKKHGGEVFSTVITVPSHPIMEGFGGFQSWDETYVHHKHNQKDRTVLEIRKQGMQEDGQTEEPWTWVRTHGNGRVFYTAWGHDERTWSNPGFHNLVERGIRWACNDDPSKAGRFNDTAVFKVPEMTAKRTDIAPFEYIEVGAKIPNYVASDKWGVQEPPLTTMQKPLPPEESLKHYVTPEGFHLEVYASEVSETEKSKPYTGLSGKPIAMNWDERGRLWLCETMDYPNELAEGNKGRDQIQICEDTNGDGAADKFTVFATGLSIPTAITFHRGGVIVQNGTETLWLKDTNGDDVADQKEVIISNWNLGDTHGGVSNMRYGLDNWFWAMQGYNNSSPILTATGEQIPSFRMGFWRFKLDDSEPPKVTNLEFIRSTNNNTWGLGISEEGLIFGSTANHNPSVFMPIPNRYYERVLGWGPEQLGTIADTHMFKPITDRVRQVDHHGGYTAAAGHALYTARNYPEQWWNKTAFVCGPTGKLVGTFVLTPDGAGYKSTSPVNLIASDDEWAAPIGAEVGPDGNVWILDWYNYVVQHNPTPQGFKTGNGMAYESDLRDKTHGRIYRVLYGEDGSPQESIEKWSLSSKDSSEKLIAALNSPTMLVRLHAQRLLVERGDASIAAALIKAAEAFPVDAIGLSPGKLHALETLKGLGLIQQNNPQVLSYVESCLLDESTSLTAIAVLPNGPETVEMMEELISGWGFLRDAKVKLAALLKLSDQASSQIAGPLLHNLAYIPEYMNDPWLRDALTSAAAAHAIPFLTSFKTQNEPQENVPPRLLEIARIVAEHVGRSKPLRGEVALIIESLTSTSPQLAAVILEGLTKGWPKNETVDLGAETEANLVKLLEHVESGSKAQVIRLASLLGSKQLEKHSMQIKESLLATISQEQADPKERTAAAQQLVGFLPNDGDVVTKLLSIITPQTDPVTATSIIESLGASTAEETGSLLLGQLNKLTPATRQAALRVLLARPGTTSDFLKAVEEGKALLADLSLDQKNGLSEHPDRELRMRARKLLAAGGGLPNADRQAVIDQLKAVTQKTGDVALGLEMFKKHCAKCHQHGEIGEKIGPNLTGMAVHPKIELLGHILDPSKSVEGNYRAYTVVTTEGRVLTGMLAGESRTSIELIDAEAKRKTLPRVDIEELIASTKSMMPEGFEKQMNEQELTDLLEFLTVKGKYVPLDFRKVASITSSKPMFYGQSPAERLVFPDWNPKIFKDIPFMLIDPQEGRVNNIVMLYGPQGVHPPNMPKQVSLPVNSRAKAIHMLSGVGGWSFPAIQEKSVSMNVKIHYADGSTEDHELNNGIHFSDYIRRVDVAESEFAYDLNGQQLRYLTIVPQKTDSVIESIDLIKGPDNTAPIVVSITVETP